MTNSIATFLVYNLFTQKFVAIKSDTKIYFLTTWFKWTCYLSMKSFAGVKKLFFFESFKMSLWNSPIKDIVYFKWRFRDSTCYLDFYIDVKICVKHCDVCQLVKVNTFYYTTNAFIRQLNAPWSRISIDIKGELWSSRKCSRSARRKRLALKVA